MNMKPVCLKCQIEMRPTRNGVKVVSMATYGPTEIRSADIWGCPGCGVEVLFGFAQDPEMSVYDPGFEERLRSYELDRRERVVEFWLNASERAKSAEGVQP
jgi:hypothetical protein